MKDYKDKNIWIIGASSGIGNALAIELDRRGASLVLSARNEKNLEALNKKLSSRHIVLPCDVTNLDTFSQAANAVSAAVGRIDSALFLAGIYQPMKLNALDMAFVQDIVKTNFTGALNFLHSTLPLFLKQGHGQIAICASVAGYRGLPNGQPYSATKAALINLTESLRAEMAPQGLDIRLITPGFVKTSLTAKNNFPMPMIIEAQTAAKALADGLLTSQFEIHFPRRFTWMMKILRLLPSSLYFRIIPK
ncbi:MAG: short-chain dehydrogenase [Micavibrio aeruginosavorus]|uniref:Short-chain dehydrogenase n=1 Tax=Micavibrio aeruginosavorus TaxID=349221 RepID=A0A2W5FHU5_9BACT|nr:MAG: short-chain dehydrogenase [Micavibrio aeruginosavorus]